MKIAPVKFHTNSRSPKFGTTGRTTYLNNNGKPFVRNQYHRDCLFPEIKYNGIVVSNSTHFLRDDMPWHNIGKKLEELFPEGKVNIHNFACSDGSETYSLAICLIEQLGEEGAKRFFPIKASDNDEYIISKAKKREIDAKIDDIVELNKLTNNNIEKYFDAEYESGRFILYPKNILKKNVKFECKDFSKGLDKIKGSNNLILCRNFWGYLSEDEIINCAKKLHKKLDENSYAIIGRFDMCEGVPFFLSELGINSASKNFKEEFILKKFDDFSDGDYGNEEGIRNRIKHYHYKKKSLHD